MQHFRPRAFVVPAGVRESCVSTRLLWSAWTASNMDTKDRMCSHADPDSTGCMRAHLLSTTPIDRLRRPREHQRTRLHDDTPGGTVRSCGEGGHTIGQQLAIWFLGIVWALEVCTVRIRFAAGTRQYSVRVRERVKLESQPRPALRATGSRRMQCRLYGCA